MKWHWSTWTLGNSELLNPPETFRHCRRLQLTAVHCAKCVCVWYLTQYERGMHTPIHTAHLTSSSSSASSGLHSWSGWDRVAELYSVKYCSLFLSVPAWTKPAGAQWGFFLGFSCSGSPPLDPSISLPLYLSAACSPMVVALILIGQQALNTLQFSVECDTLYIM